VDVAVDKSILERVAAGDRFALNQCLETYSGLVWSLARRFVGNHADAEDAVQEVFIELWRTADRFDPQLGSEATFISTVARRRFIDRQRRRSRRLDAVSLDQEQLDRPASDPPHLEIQDEVRRVQEAMHQLRPEEQQVLHLSLTEGLSQAEIAQRTELPLGTVKSHARRGLERLRSMLGVERETRALA
jgi:RNA polymerase sigma-70 factor (ECF subfamily)